MHLALGRANLGLHVLGRRLYGLGQLARSGRRYGHEP